MYKPCYLIQYDRFLFHLTTRPSFSPSQSNLHDTEQMQDTIVNEFCLTTDYKLFSLSALLTVWAETGERIILLM